ncbi:MAG: GatB/YqeY domain-containing protein [Desulfarculaceae bacterium]|jgi:uncharacterized protein YqeY
MGLGQKVDADLKAALKAKDELATSCLRLVRAALKNKEKELRRDLTEDEDIQVLKTLAKQRQESIAKFTEGGRTDLADKESAELKIIERYLPAQMDESEVGALLDQVFSELDPQGMKDMGGVMKEAMARLKGRADGKLVNQLVRQRLQS